MQQTVQESKKKSSHMYKGYRATEGSSSGLENYLILIIPAKRVKIHGALVLQPRPHTYKKEDEKAESWIPKG